MSMGKPAVGNYMAGIPEQIENLKTGIIVPPKNAEELKKCNYGITLSMPRLAEYS